VEKGKSEKANVEKKLAEVTKILEDLYDYKRYDIDYYSDAVVYFKGQQEQRGSQVSVGSGRKAGRA